MQHAESPPPLLLFSFVVQKSLSSIHHAHLKNNTLQHPLSPYPMISCWYPYLGVVVIIPPSRICRVQKTLMASRKEKSWNVIFADASRVSRNRESTDECRGEGCCRFWRVVGNEIQSEHGLFGLTRMKKVRRRERERGKERGRERKEEPDGKKA